VGLIKGPTVAEQDFMLPCWSVSRDLDASAQKVRANNPQFGTVKSTTCRREVLFRERTVSSRKQHDKAQVGRVVWNEARHEGDQVTSVACRSRKREARHFGPLPEKDSVGKKPRSSKAGQ
jgi:hypothetical protein